jgi:hypothetical protein
VSLVPEEDRQDRGGDYRQAERAEAITNQESVEVSDGQEGYDTK